MMLGSPSHFAVEIGIEGHENSCLLGTISYLIGARRVGDPELITALGDYAMQVPRALDFRGKRDSEWLWHIDESEAFRWMDQRLYGHSGVAFPEEEVDAAARLDVTIGLDSLDAWKIYLVQNGEFEKLIFSESPYNQIYFQILPRDLFDRVIFEAFEFLNKLDEPASP